ncbi:MAG: creatininase family protein [candidate division Zixibacteria bacterium]|nr:creatininase family protein [candidate division Zixibacteria bacterium]
MEAGITKEKGKVARLAELSWKEFGELVPARYDAVVIPVGTVEAHGGIPLGTDIIIPEYLAERLAGRLNFIIAPTVNYGITRTMLPYPGSHAVAPATFRQYVTEVFVGFGRMGFRKLVVVNGHGGHVDELREAAQVAYRDADLFTVVLHWWLMAPEASEEVYGGEGGHAAAEETAGVLAARPELVKAALLAGLNAAKYEKGVFRMPFPRPVGVREFGKAMPSADVESAKKYMAVIEKRCVEAVEEAFAGWREELGR